MAKEKAKKQKERGQGGLHKSFLTMTLFPLILMGVVIVLFGGISYRNGLYSEVQSGLKSVAVSVRDYYDYSYLGEYSVSVDKGTKEQILKKGNAIISSDHALLDQLSADTDLELSIFFGDTRMLSSIKRADGQRVTGTLANPIVTKSVLEKGEDFFTRSVMIEDTSYFAQYIPILDKSGKAVGMIAVAKPSEEVTKLVNGLVIRNMVIVILVLLLALFAINRFTNTIVSVITKLMTFLEGMENGTLNGSLDHSVLTREDEIGNIGRASVEVQNSLRKLVEKDALTNLYNRRSGQIRVASSMQKAKKNNDVFAIAICDIDFFKKVNDTYGHDAGDEVLRRVARALGDHMFGNGFAARWGGEEFLLVFDRKNSREAAEILEEIRFEIEHTVIEYEEKEIHVTMSFGVITGNQDQSIEVQISGADERLYFAKEHGRNQICSISPEKALARLENKIEGEDGSI